MQTALCQQDEMDRFLEDPSVPLLQAALVKEGSTFDIQLSNSVKTATQPEMVEAVIHVTKAGAHDNITMDNIQRTVVLSSLPSPGQRSTVQGLYNSLHNIFLPLLLDKENGLDPQLQAMLQDLDASLGKQVRSGPQRGDDALESTAGILSLDDEVDFWRDQERSDDREHAAAGQEFFPRVQAIRKGLEDGHQGTYEDLLSEVELEGQVAPSSSSSSPTPPPDVAGGGRWARRSTTFSRATRCSSP